MPRKKSTQAKTPRKSTANQKEYREYWGKCMEDAPKGKGSGAARKEASRECGHDWTNRAKNSPFWKGKNK